MANSAKNQEQLMSMEVSVTRHYGTVSVTLNLGGSFVVSNQTDTDKVFERLSVRVNQQHDLYQKRHLANETQSVASSHVDRGSSASDGRTFEELPITSITRDVHKGGEMAKVRVPGYEKFGISMWSEVYQKYSDLIKYNESGVDERDGMIARIEFRNGKPKRVVKIMNSVANEG